MKQFGFWVVWLKAVSVLFAVFGIVIALLNQTPLFDAAFNNQINPVFWGNGGLVAETVYFQQWVYGLLGATCVMIGVLIFSIIHNSFAQKEKWAWNCLLIGLVTWFIIDEPVSLYFHVYFNAIFNLVLLAAFIIPLFLTRKSFN